MKQVLALLTTALVLFSCSSTQQVDDNAKNSGFLGTYDNLTAGTGDQPNTRYVANGVNWKKYKKVKVNPVQVWAGEDSELKKIDKKELEKIVSYVHAELRKELAKSFELTDSSGLDVLELRIAMTDGASSNVALDTISNVVPVGLALTHIKNLATGTHLVVGEAHMEFEVLDSSSRQRLVAGTDARAGGKTLEGKFDKWDDIKSAFEFWSKKIRTELSKRGAGK